jgi:hypothetical protein
MSAPTQPNHCRRLLLVALLTPLREMGNPLGIAACQGGLAQAAAADGRAEEAAYLFGATPEPMRAVGWLFLPVDPTIYRVSQDAARAALGERVWREAYERGRRAMSEAAAP